MRRKSERVKDKDKPADKKTDKSSKKTRTRSSRRRKKSSTSPESSETEDYDTSFQDDTEEEYSSGRSKREKSKAVYADEEAVAADSGLEEKVVSGRTRKSSKKQTAEDEDQVQSDLSNLKSDEKLAEGSDSKGETSDQKHKEKEGKSSMWQVKSADCSSGEIKKLKLCIVRPPEPTELSPHKRKKLSRSSHRDIADGETDEGMARDSSGERRKSRRALRNASDDSTSPEKKGKHKSGDSSEDGQRTQDSEEMTRSIVEVSVNKPVAIEESSQDEIMTITTSGAKDGEPIAEVQEVSDLLEVQVETRDPLEDKARRPLVTFEEKSVSSPPQTPEKSVDSPSPSPSPEPSPEPRAVTPVDPFDALISDTKAINNDASVKVVIEDEPTVVDESIVACDSTEELQKSRNVVKKAVQSVEEVRKEVISHQNKIEVCESSVELPNLRDSPVEVLQVQVSPEDRESPDSIEEKTEESSKARPSGRELSEEKQATLSSTENKSAIEQSVDKTQGRKLLEKSSRYENSLKEQTKVLVPESSEKDKNVSETSKESKKDDDTPGERPRSRRLSEEKIRSHEPSDESKKDRRRSRPQDSPEHKSRSRRLNRYSTGDRASRHKTSPHKSTHTDESSKKENERKEVSSKKDMDKTSPHKSTHSDESSKKENERKEVGSKKDMDKTSPHKSTHSDESSKKENERKEVGSKKDMVEVTLKMDEQRAEVSPKKSKEERDHRRTKVVWEEKPPVESRRLKPIVETSRKKSIENNVKEIPTEKITLKRSTSNKTKPATGDTDDSTCLPVGGVSEDQTNANAESVNNTSELSNVPRKRRWGAGKASSVPKKPVLSISSDSLKSLIPEAKPLTISEVQLAPEEAEEGEVGDDSDHAPSDVEENNVEVELTSREHSRDVKLVSPAVTPEGPAPPNRINIVLTDEPREKAGPARKISIVTDEMRSLQRSPSPARHRASEVLFLTNLVRPFTLNQLKELLARTGTLVEGGFWIDKIKSKCYVQYSTETEARETRHALHGVRWPVSNPKQLCVDYAKKEDLDLAKELAEGSQIPRKTEPLKVEGWEMDREKERERLLREREKLERERLRGKESDRERTLKMSASVREWDVGKMEMGTLEDGRQSREEKNRERDRRTRKDRDYRSPSPRDGPARKLKKKEDDAPAKLLDDLFKKTKVTPCIYWLPLTAEQIVVKEEMRRKHMAEHERRMAEMRKAERGGAVGGRNQGRPPPPRRFADKRRRRTLSASPKK